MKELQQALINLSILIIPVVGTFIMTYIKKKTTEIQNKINNDNVNKYISLASDAIQSSVTAVFQTYVDTLKKDGKFDKEAQQEAFNKAKEKSMSIMGDTTKEIIKEAYGDIDQFVNIMIEKYINDLKSK